MNKCMSWLFSFCCLYATDSFATPIRAGFNQAWFHDHYAGQYLDSDYDQGEVEVYRPYEQDAAQRARFKYVITEEGSADFLQYALRPFLRALDVAGLAGEIERIDLMNEGDAAVNRFGFEGGWKGAGRLLCQWRAAIHEQEGFAKTPVTFSIRLSRVLPLPVGIFRDQGAMTCADYLDFHSYNNTGGIHLCDRVAKYASSGGKEVVLGEYGQSYFNKRYDDDLQTKLTRTYLDQAERCGFTTALAWRLSDVRPGQNPESRYSFEADTGPRPAFHVIRERNRTGN